ncbi:hypothetical protein CcaCcLH18_11313 [Colletotrichum camelliae]|nr:hypothetical protein CcaCcLH18_11313 [Colletotrichum camelliae]
MDDVSRRLEELTRRLAEAEARAKGAEEERDEERRQTRPTTLNEYIAACHSLVFSSLDVETDRELTSKGPITNPRNKWCPTNLRPWDDFLQQQDRMFGILYDTFPADSRLFENRSFLSGLGTRIARRKINDEKALEYFLHNSVEHPVRTIMDELKNVEEVRRAFDLGDGIIFENHPHAISDAAEEVVRRENPSTPPSTPRHTALDLKQLRADQICIYRSEPTNPTKRTILYVSEYKPPHKLTAPHLRLGLRSMNIYKEVVNRKTIPTSVDADARFQYHAERLTAAAITQTYHYMIEGGLEYGLLTTGEAIVFLRIDWTDPETLLYHLAEPAAEVQAHPDHSHLWTAVGQYLAFSLMAVGLLGERKLHGQDERHEAMKMLKTWSEDFETTLRSIPDGERRAPDSSPGYQPTTYKEIDRSPYLLRGKRRSKRAHARDEPPRNERRDPELSSDDESRRDIPNTPTPMGRETRQATSSTQGGQGTRRSQRVLARQPGGKGGGGSNDHGGLYCTQKCLLGLARGVALDTMCPNLLLHSGKRSSAGGRRRDLIRTAACHPIDRVEFLDLLRKQLQRTLDKGITPLGRGGACGVLFKVTLLEYGYTFVSKGTVEAFIRDVVNEAAVYEHLQQIQGIHLPVFLGAIDLRSLNRIYYYDHRVYVVHMMFLSWGGEDLRNVDVGQAQIQRAAMRSLHAVHSRGVEHRDIRSPNMLFNVEVKGVMLIDFERALLLERPRRPLAQLVPNKRRRKPVAGDVAGMAGKRRNGGVVHEEYTQETETMRAALREHFSSQRRQVVA